MENQRRGLLVVGAGVEQVRAYDLARELGLFVVGSDRDPAAPALARADAAIVADTHDAEASVRAALAFHRGTHRIDGVMTLAHDVPFTVARIAEALGLPGLSLRTARLATQKLAMKEAFAAAGVAVPRFREVRTAAEVADLAGQWGLPLVIKPVDSCGARGVLRITPGVDPERAFEHARALSREQRVIAEAFVPGLQLSTESFVTGGTCHTVAWAERNYELLERFAPNVIEDGGVLPAELDEDQVHAVDELVARAARALGVEEGPVKGDLVLGPDGPVVIELAARLSGGYFCTDQIPLACGVDLVRQTIRAALGDPVDPAELVPEHRTFVAGRHFLPPPGRVESIEGYDELAALDWVVKRALYCAPGDVIEPVTDHTRRAGVVLARGATRAEAVARAVEAAGRVAIRTVPLERAA